MKDLANKFYAVLISTALLSIFIGWLLHTPEEERLYECCYMSFAEGVILTLLPVFSIYLLFGFISAVIIDKMTAVLNRTRFLYLFQLLLYSLAGLLSGVLLTLPNSAMDSTFLAILVSIPASLIYYHTYLAVKIISRTGTKRTS
ncbi:hypothetical protein [Bacillus marinisedimentorum]|uniref:hypothetical protein n=1 Tax=Bacillus marinisedimentorum TaxID=1821260 RepID=UPI00082443E1|nr:hypothetical protein [Bacillus marinisedimentorum]